MNITNKQLIKCISGQAGIISLGAHIRSFREFRLSHCNSYSHDVVVRYRQRKGYYLRFQDYKNTGFKISANHNTLSRNSADSQNRQAYDEYETFSNISFRITFCATLTTHLDNYYYDRHFHDRNWKFRIIDRAILSTRHESYRYYYGHDRRESSVYIFKFRLANNTKSICKSSVLCTNRDDKDSALYSQFRIGHVYVKALNQREYGLHELRNGKYNDKTAYNNGYTIANKFRFGLFMVCDHKFKIINNDSKRCNIKL